MQAGRQSTEKIIIPPPPGTTGGLTTGHRQEQKRRGAFFARQKVKRPLARFGFEKATNGCGGVARFLFSGEEAKKKPPSPHASIKQWIRSNRLSHPPSLNFRSATQRDSKASGTPGAAAALPAKQQAASSSPFLARAFFHRTNACHRLLPPQLVAAVAPAGEPEGRGWVVYRELQQQQSLLCSCCRRCRHPGFRAAKAGRAAAAVGWVRD